MQWKGMMQLTLIYLDAGHGGTDGGASGNGISEKDIVLKICKKIQKQLGSYDCQVAMSRESDIYLSLDERTNKANRLGADVLVSVHNNGHTSSSANGFESFIYPSADSGTVAFQNVMHQEIMNAMGGSITDRGKKSANFHMLRESRMKAILTENLFITNRSNADRLKDDSFLEKIAQGHTNGLEKFLGLKKVARPPNDDSDAGQGQKLWKVQVGAFAQKENADALADDLFKQGYRPFVKYE